MLLLICRVGVDVYVLVDTVVDVDIVGDVNVVDVFRCCC